MPLVSPFRHVTSPRTVRSARTRQGRARGGGGWRVRVRAVRAYLPNVREEGLAVVGVARHGGVRQRPAAVELLVRVRVRVRG